MPAELKEVSCVILVGGESRRMGSDKSKIRLNGRSLLAHVLDAVKDIFRDIMVSAHTPDYSHDDIKGLCGIRLVTDRVRGRGPSLGVCAALESAENPWIFVLPCDLPMVNVSLIRYLAQLRNGYDCVVPVVGGRIQPLFALYRKTCLEPLVARIGRGGGSKRERGLAGFIEETEQIKVRYVDESELKEADPELRSFMDVDTVEELKKVESILKKEETAGNEDN